MGSSRVPKLPSSPPPEPLADDARGLFLLLWGLRSVPRSLLRPLVGALGRSLGTLGRFLGALGAFLAGILVPEALLEALFVAFHLISGRPHP